MKRILLILLLGLGAGGLPVSAAPLPSMKGTCETTPWPILQEASFDGVRFQATPGGLIVEDITRGKRRVWTACDGLAATHITAVAPLSREIVYVAFRGNGVTRLDLRTGKTTPLKFDTIRWATSLALLDDVLYVGTVQDGLWALAENGGPLRVEQPRWRFRKKRVSSLAIHEGALLIARDLGGLWRWTPGQKEQRVLKGSVQQVRVLPNGKIEVLRGLERCILGTRRRCARIPDSPNIPTLPPLGALPSNHLTALVVHPDKEGVPRLWAGTFDRGVVVHIDGHWVKPDTENTPPRFINQLISVGDDLWAATPTGAFRLRDARWSRYGEQAGLLTDHVNAVHAGKGDRLFFATSKGLTIWDETGLRTQGEEDGLPDRIVYSVTTLGDSIIAGTLEGLAIHQGEGWRAYRTEDGSLSDNWINAVSVGPAGGVFVGTYDAGIDKLVDGHFSHEPTRLPLWINPNGLIWNDAISRFFACTLGDGLWWRSMEGSWEVIRGPGALPSDDVTAVAVHQNQLWVATRNGLARLPLAPFHGTTPI